MKAFTVSDAASADVDRALDYYARERPHAARRLLAALRSTFEKIEESPRAGSRRYADLVEAPLLRHRATPRFPYLVFYMDLEEEIVVLRVLHQRSDIQAQLSES